MPRFSLDLSRHESVDIIDNEEFDLTEYETSREHDDDQLYSEPSDETGIDDSSDEEPPHPLGFKRSARYRLLSSSNHEESIDMAKYRRNYLYPFEQLSSDSPAQHQQYPSLASYLDPDHVSSKEVIRYIRSPPSSAALQSRDRGKGTDDTLEQVTALLRKASLAGEQVAQRLVSERSSYSHNNLNGLHKQEQRAQIVQEMQQEKARMDREHVEMTNAIRELVESEQKQRKLLQRQEDEENERQEAKHKEEQKQRQMQKDAEAARSKRRDDEEREVREEKKIRERQRSSDSQSVPTKASSAIASSSASGEEYLLKAKKLVSQLVQVRASIEPFARFKAVAKRRLSMKKIVNGRMNTLAENADKIRSVALEVSQAIAQAKEEDEQIKAQLQRGSQQVSSEMARGKRYLLDLLCSKVIVRVQADGFNGQRGDGFPLAHMLAIVSLDHKELGPLLAAHLYTVCPIAIPKLPTISAASSEEDFMRGIGMMQDRNGEYESFETFLARTERVISIEADIMASGPSNHTLLGGHEGAMVWLSRFLSTLPESPQSPLPLLTAPVLESFLKGAGHMLANVHGEEFRKWLHVISDDVLKRLDVGPIGKPSSIRLRRAVEDGFEGFKRDRPLRALPELYNPPSGRVSQSGWLGSQSRMLGQNSNSSQSPFTRGLDPSSEAGSSALSAPIFGTGNSSVLGTSAPPAPASLSGPNLGGTSNPFGSTMKESTPFARSSDPSPQQNPFGVSSAGSATQATPNPFSSSTGSSTSWFHPSTGASTSNLATSASNKLANTPTTSSGATNASMIIGAPSQPSPFTSSVPSSTFPNGNQQSNFAKTNSGSGPFGGVTSAHFSSSSDPPPSTPFGIFGSTSSANNTQPFGSNPTTLSYGGSVAGSSTHATPFSSQTPAAPFGSDKSILGSSTSATPFSAPAHAAPFGSSSSMLGSSANATPFGAQAPAALFGSSSNATPFETQAPASSFFSSTTNTGPSAVSAPPAAFGSSSTIAGPSTVATPAAPFGSSNSSPFFASAPAPLETSMTTSPGPSSIFGNTTSNSLTSSLPFGVSGNVATSSSSPFGAFAPGPNSAPLFGNTNVNTAAAAASTDASGGSNDKRPLCRYYAEGRCRFGQECRYRHDSGHSGFSDPFGGPRR